MSLGFFHPDASEVDIHGFTEDATNGISKMCAAFLGIVGLPWSSTRVTTILLVPSLLQLLGFRCLFVCCALVASSPWVLSRPVPSPRSVVSSEPVLDSISHLDSS